MYSGAWIEANTPFKEQKVEFFEAFDNCIKLWGEWE